MYSLRKPIEEKRRQVVNYLCIFFFNYKVKTTCLIYLTELCLQCNIELKFYANLKDGKVAESLLLICAFIYFTCFYNIALFWLLVQYLFCFIIYFSSLFYLYLFFYIPLDIKLTFLLPLVFSTLFSKLYQICQD